MSDDRTFQHLRISRSEPVTARRLGGNPHPKPPPSDKVGFASRLRGLLTVVEQAPPPTTGFDPRRLIKLVYEGDPDRLQQAFPGLAVVSQENKTLTVAFATDEALGEFHRRLEQVERRETPKYDGVLFSVSAIDLWSAADRLGRALAAARPLQSATCSLDVELWTLDRANERDLMVASFRSWCRDKGVHLLDSRVTAEMIVFRVSLASTLVEELLDYRDARLVDLPPRFGFESHRLGTSLSKVEVGPPPADSAPRIAVLDTGIAAAHPLLERAVGDAQAFTPGAPAYDENGHGTHVAGLVLYGDVEQALADGSFTPRLWLLSGRISDLGDGDDAESELIENRIERAVQYFVENYGCKIFMLAFCEREAVYQGGHVSRFAQLIDLLAKRFDVLFVLPTGNFREGGNMEIKQCYPDYLLGESARLLEPAPALNALTIGSLARHEQTTMAQRYPNDPRSTHVARRNEPSPFTRRGPGPRGAIKPDLVDYGGNFGLDGEFAREIGELSLNHDFATGGLFAQQAGSSFAAPKIAHAAGRLLEQLPAASPDLLRALLVAHASIPQACTGLLRGDDQSRLSELVGHGRPSIPESLFSTERRVTLWGEAEISDDHSHFYEIPIPTDFIAGPKSRSRRITIVVSHMPDVRRTRYDYRGSRMEFRLVRARDEEQVTEVYRRAEKEAGVKGRAKNTVPTIPEPRGVSPTSSVRDRCTVQRATWNIHRMTRDWESKKPFVVVTSHPPVWGRTAERVERYAIVVVVEDRSEHPVRLYSQLRAVVEQRVRVQRR